VARASPAQSIPDDPQMSIVFFCSQCGARFEVGEQAAGKAGRCKRCGERITVPAAAAKPVAAAVVAAGGAGGTDWLANVSSQAALAPLTVGRVPGIRTRDPNLPPVDDDLGDSKPYAVVSNWKMPVVRRAKGSSAPAGGTTILWRKGWGSIERLFRRINEFAYLLSIPFIILLLIGASTKNRSLAMLGAEAVVLLNLGRVFTGLANIFAIPFREGLTTGLLFLFPPYTIKYMIDHWKKLRRPTQRVVTPLLTIAAVVLAFVFLPSLAGDGGKKAGDEPKSMIQGR
jgi:DNA-directed RNA polymerase subunit RPC12/RpoP